MSENKNIKHDKVKVPLSGWLSLILLIIVFSGVFTDSDNFMQAFDFNNLVGRFGEIFEGINFTGQGGTGAREGFIFALTLFPTIALAVGLIETVEHMGGLIAAQKLFTPILRPLLGIPGITGLAFVSSFTSSDVGSVMTKELYDQGELTDDERTKFVAYQYPASAVILNTVGTQAPLLPIVTLPLGALIVFLFLLKVLASNLVRLYLMFTSKKEGAK